MENFENFKIKGKIITKEEKEDLISQGVSYCSQCKIVKPISEFNYASHTPYKINSSCKECDRIKSANRRLDFPDRTKEVRRNSRNKNKEYYNQAKKDWAESNREHVREYKRDRYNNDPEYKMQLLCRAMVKRMFKSTGIKKCYKTSEVLGYTSKDLKEHIEKQFLEGMTWDNHGEWHIDHIIPLSIAKSLKEGIELSQLSNLQPLWAKDNLEKKDKILAKWKVKV